MRKIGAILLSPISKRPRRACASSTGTCSPGLGDSLTAVFGYPQARENDAERAVRAALAIQKAIGDLNDQPGKRRAPRLSARIGLDAGKVVVDSMGGVFGKATSIAARVQAAAEPGSVLVTANVQRQVAGLFVAEDRGARELRGVPQPVNLYRIVRAVTGPRRIGLRTLTPLAGREQELALLMRRWERARSGKGQLALIVGEPGIGKSRLFEGVPDPAVRNPAHLDGVERFPAVCRIPRCIRSRSGAANASTSARRRPSGSLNLKRS